MTFTMIIDVETNGLPEYRGVKPFIVSNFNHARLIELGYILINNNNNKVVKKFSKLINTNVLINNSDIHGITEDMVHNEGISINSMFSEFGGDLEEVDQIVAHNISFDINIILSELYRLYNSTNQFNVKRLIGQIYLKKQICTMKFCATNFIEFKKYPKLIDLHKMIYYDENMHQTHRALDDVMLCYDVYVFLKNNSLTLNNKDDNDKKVSFITLLKTAK